MKNFLFDKFNNLTIAVNDAFREEITRNLPSADWIVPLLWGYDSDGFWVMTRDDIRFYENNGNIHVLGAKYSESYVTNYQAVASALDGMRSLAVDETDSFEITNTEHILLPAGTKVSYVKFTAPNGELGLSATATMLTHDAEYNTNFIKDAIETHFYKIYQSLKTVGCQCPSETTPEDIFFDSQGAYMGLLHDFTVDFQTSADNFINRGMKIVGDLNQDEIKPLIENGTTLWQALMI